MKNLSSCLSLILFSGLHVNMFYAQTVVLSDSVIVQPQVFSNLDSLIIQNCAFENITGGAVLFSNIDYVEISGCELSGVSNNTPTKAAICGKATRRVVLKNLNIQNTMGTAIRIPTDGATAIADRVNFLLIDSVQIYNCQKNSVQPGDAVRVFHTDTVIISNSTVRLADNSGFSLGRNDNSSMVQQLQKIRYCHAFNNRIDSVLSDGIGSQRNIDFAIIENNTITHVAYDGEGARPAHGDHGIYWQAPNAIIRNNVISHVYDGMVSGHPGSGISLRTNATIADNIISYCTGNGIGYFNDHRANGNTLIFNNVIHDCNSIGIYHNGSNGNNLNPDLVRHPDSVFIYHNTVINEPLQASLHLSAPIAFNSMSGKNFLAGNILIFETVSDTNAYIFVHNNPHLVRQYNHFASGDIAFEDYQNRNLMLTAASSAVDFLPAGVTFVSHDILGNARMGPHDAGAFEFIPVTTSQSPLFAKNPHLQIFPNPSAGRVHFTSSQEVGGLNIFDTSGKLITKIKVDSMQGAIDLHSSSGKMLFIQFVFTDGSNTLRKVVVE
ncbi:MAG: right-handed parallel beta-helix repeat-containing protein [Saprospiraceae bacterium]|nr:right-handed parallel beta-helix repeat-containing protein [Saprospiraceae bacterium]